MWFWHIINTCCLAYNEHIYLLAAKYQQCSQCSASYKDRFSPREVLQSKLTRFNCSACSEAQECRERAKAASLANSYASFPHFLTVGLFVSTNGTHTSAEGFAGSGRRRSKLTRERRFFSHLLYPEEGIKRYLFWEKYHAACFCSAGWFTGHLLFLYSFIQNLSGLG